MLQSTYRELIHKGGDDDVHTELKAERRWTIGPYCTHSMKIKSIQDLER